ncbi:GNAT family N-acetyltransferase [Quadrisphaera sp. INWT6]|uniref:GNAT family N-acetyltransferase n=1 Tax=Quadrisphaera sp. INWT6 TaxID=2596917 RepID=UPI0018925804|nr:GNAT family N-acetyltransferase [Quadrisphaera sp. INWT6]
MANDPGAARTTERLLLRPWRIPEATVQRQLWLERDPRVPAHRRINADGHPTLAELQQRIRTQPPPTTCGLLAVQRLSDDAVLGYCGLIEGEGDQDPELAFELLRRFWGQGYATEAATAVVDWARSSGHHSLKATVWDWNTASRRVLAKVGFTEVATTEPVSVYGSTVVTTMPLQPAQHLQH